MRDVTQAAGVNLASVSYHFGGKEGLIQETVKRCMNPINEYRIRLLGKAIKECGGLEKIPLRRVVECLMRPVIKPEECDVRIGLMLRLVARYLIESDYTIPSVSRRLYTEMFQIFTKALLVHFPHLSPVQVVKQIIFSSGTVVYYHGLGGIALQISAGKQGDANDVDEIDRDEMLEDVMDFVINGFGGREDS